MPVPPTFIPAVAVAARRRRIIRKFEEAGADQPARARGLEELGVRESLLLSRLVRSGVLVRVEGDRYFLSAEGVTRWNERRKSFVVAVVSVVVVSIVACILIFRGR